MNNQALGESLGMMTKQLLEKKYNIKFRETFHTLYDSQEDLDGKRFEIVRELTDVERDPEVGRMYKIKFEDGTLFDAWAEEVEEWNKIYNKEC